VRQLVNKKNFDNTTVKKKCFLNVAYYLCVAEEAWFKI